MGKRWGVAIVGVATVTVYAGLAALEALVLDPLAAVPGRSLGQIHARLTDLGFDVAGDVRSVLLVSLAGVVLAVLVAVFGVVRQVDPVVLAVLFLAVVALGAPAVFSNGFALGMDVADGYGVGGEDHTIWAGVLYLTSLAAALAIPVVLLTSMVRTRRRRPAPA